MESWLEKVVVVDDDDRCGGNPPKRSRTTTNNKKPIFKKDLIQVDGFADVQVCLQTYPTHLVSVENTYRLPIKCMESTTFEKLKALLMTEPKRVLRNHQLVHKPWSMYVLYDDCIYIPRGIGMQLFQLHASPPKRHVKVEPCVNFPTPTRPLLDADAAAAMYKTDQVTAVDHLVDHLHTMVDKYGFGTAAFCLPTGHGKTACAIHVLQRLGKRTLFVVPSMDPCYEQFKDEVRGFLGESVTVGSMHTSTKSQWKDHDTADCVVTTMDSLRQCNYNLEGFGLTIVDEAHEACTRARSKLFLKVPSTYVVALTATPERHSDYCGAYIEWLCGPVVMYKAIDVKGNRWGGLEVRLVSLKGHYQAFVEPKNKRSGDVNDAKLLNEVMMCRERNRAVMEYIHKQLVIDEDRHVVCLSPRTWHIEVMTSLLEHAGTSTGMLVGERMDGSSMTPEERKEAKTKRVLVANVTMGSRALNVPRLDTLCYITGGCWNNETFWTQAIGRILRDKENKNQPVVVLFVDETNNGYLSRQVDRAVATLKRIGGDGTRVMTSEW